MASDPVIRDILARSLGWSDAHVSFDEAVGAFPAHLRGTRPAGLPHSGWELVEHIRIAQRDILEFVVGDDYHQPDWPSGYWPSSPQPPTTEAWDESISAVKADRETLARLARDSDVELDALARHGSTQTNLREFLLVIDHAAYHVGQLVLVRQALGAWPAA